jgi:chromate reductase
MIRLLAISGSLRAASSNTALLRAAARVAPAGVEVQLYGGLGELPHFNPDLEDAEPPAVSDLRARVRVADGLLISCPEYAHGVPGVLKNALDWLVSGEEIVGKPIAFFNASSRGAYALASLTQTLTAMSTRLVPEASVTLPLLGTPLDEEGILARPEMADPLRAALTAFARAIEDRRAQAAGP